MHDVAKTTTPRIMKPMLRSILKAVLWLALLVALVICLKLLGVSILAMLAIVFAALVIMLGWFSFRAFRGGRPTAGTVFGVLCLFCVLAEVKVNQFRAMGSMPHQMPATTVTSATVKEEDWAPILSAVGSVSAVQGAVISSELGGVVTEVRFQNGGVAKKGDVLVRLAATSEDADLELAQSDLMRTRDLAARKVISKAELDAAESKLKQKGGAVEKKEVRAPFDGQLGIRQVNVGQMIKAGDLVVSLTALDPVFVDFALPQQDLAKLATGFEVRL
jgi:membrane fusion protein, multidrug efflux system